MILVPSVEIAKQTAAAVDRAHPDLTVDVEQGRREANGTADVTVATVATLVAKEGRRLTKFDPRGFKAVIIDEAHHACADTWKFVLEHFHPAMRKPSQHDDLPPPPSAAVVKQPDEYNTPLIGFSATLARADGMALGAVFERIVYHNGMLDLMNSGHLAPLRFTMIRGHMNLSSLSVSATKRGDTEDGGGDFTSASMGKALNVPELNELLVKTWLYRCWNLPDRTPSPATPSPHADDDLSTKTERYKRRSTLVFCATRQHLAGVVDAFRRAGVMAYGVDSSTPSADRAHLLSLFQTGQFPVLVNCGVFTEGTDIPLVDCVLIARPTRSQGRYQQMIGRGTRQSPTTGKVDCLVLDYVSAAEGAKGAICAPTLFGLDPQLDEVEQASIEELMRRKMELLERKKETEQMALFNPGGGSGESNEPRQDASSAVAMSDKVTMTEYDSIASLQQALDLREQSRSPILSESQLAWTECGNDTYILSIPSVGRIRLAPGDEEPPEEDREKDEWKDEDEDEDEDEEQGYNLERPQMWIGTFVRQLRTFQGRNVHTRPVKIVSHYELGSAIRACDTYALKHGGVGRKQLLRTAPWRQGPASEGQARFIAKRLGLTPQGMQDMGLDEITRGEANHMITRLTAGPAKCYARGVTKRLKERQKTLASVNRPKRTSKQQEYAPSMDVFGTAAPRL